VEYAEQARFYRNSFKYKLLSFFDKNSQEYIKCVARSFRRQEKIISKKYLFMGHARAIAYILKRCSLLLPNSQSEYERLKRDFPETGSYCVVPNGVDTDIFYMPVRDEVRGNKVLCAARIEPQKNQLNLIKAIRGTPYLLTLAGAVAPNHQYYYRQCREAAGANVRFAGLCSAGEMAKMYREHRVHVLPSWFETTGLSSLEAAACGCSIVVTDKGDTRAYFGDHASYCDPSDADSIREAISEAMHQPGQYQLLDEIKDRYNWKVAARETVKAYQHALRI
jgi:glycosyltransferase involved in cell wall biosynthesis